MTRMRISTMNYDNNNNKDEKKPEVHTISMISSAINTSPSSRDKNGLFLPFQIYNHRRYGYS